MQDPDEGWRFSRGFFIGIGISGAMFLIILMALL